MLKLVVLVGMVAVALSAPQFPQFTFGAQPGPQVAAAPAVPVPTVNPTNFVSSNNPDGSAVFGFQTLDGQSRSESVGIDGSRRGSYSYIDANGQPVNVYYIADNQGYRTSPTPFPAAAPAAAAAPAPAAVAQPQQATFPQFSFFQPQQAAQPNPFAFQTFQAAPQQIQHHHQVTTPAPVTAAPTTQAPAAPAAVETHQAQQAFNPFVGQPFGLFGLQQFGAQPGQLQFGRR